MQTVVINIEHPDDVPASQFVDTAIKSVLSDIDADSPEGWAVTVVANIADKALRTAIALTLSDFPDAWDNEKILEAIIEGHDDIVVWEPFEYWEPTNIIEHIQGTAQAIAETFK